MIEEKKSNSLERSLCFWITFVIITIAILAWVARFTIFVNASIDVRLGLLMFYVMLPFVAMGAFSMYRSRARQQWVAELCFAATFSYVVIFSAAMTIIQTRRDLVVLKDGLSWASVILVAFIVLICVIIPGSLFFVWRKALGNLPEERQTENKPD